MRVTVNRTGGSVSDSLRDLIEQPITGAIGRFIADIQNVSIVLTANFEYRLLLGLRPWRKAIL